MAESSAADEPGPHPGQPKLVLGGQADPGRLIAPSIYLLLGNAVSYYGLALPMGGLACGKAKASGLLRAGLRVNRTGIC